MFFAEGHFAGLGTVFMTQNFMSRFNLEYIGDGLLRRIFTRLFRKFLHFLVRFSANQDHLVCFGVLCEFCLTSFANIALHYAKVLILGGKGIKYRNFYPINLFGYK